MTFDVGYAGVSGPMRPRCFHPEFNCFGFLRSRLSDKMQPAAAGDSIWQERLSAVWNLHAANANFWLEMVMCFVLSEQFISLEQLLFATAPTKSLLQKAVILSQNVPGRPSYIWAEMVG